MSLADDTARLAQIRQYGNGSTITNVDAVSASLTYVGTALTGTLNSSAGWSIKKITVTGSITQVQLAPGSLTYTDVWDNRASLSYS